MTFISEYPIQSTFVTRDLFVEYFVTGLSMYFLKLSLLDSSTILVVRSLSRMYRFPRPEAFLAIFVECEYVFDWQERQAETEKEIQTAARM